MRCSILQGMLAPAWRQGAGCVVSHDIVTQIVIQNMPIIVTQDMRAERRMWDCSIASNTVPPSHKLQRCCLSWLATPWSALTMLMVMDMIMMVINARCDCIHQNTFVANGARPP